jgi:Kelch motif
MRRPHIRSERSKRRAMSKPAESRLIFVQPFLAAVAGTLLFLSFLPQAVTQSAWTHKGIRARYNHSAVFDSGTGELIVFGGQHTINFPNFSDTFAGITTAGSPDLNWTAELTGPAPPARFGHTAVYDSVNSRMVIFGGGSGNLPGPCLNDVWVLRNANGVSGGSNSWSQQMPSGSAPVSRFAHTAVYDSGTNSMIVFGGYDCNSNYLNDVWVLNDANGLVGTPSWTQLSPTGTPPSGREGSTAVYDQTDNLLIVFGGDAGSTPFNDVWVLSNANGNGGVPVWSQLFPTGADPIGRTGHTAIYDAVNNRMTIYAGQTMPAVPVTTGASSGLLNDLWVLINANGLSGIPAWNQLTPATTAAHRSFHTAAYNSSNNTMITFGGKTTVVLLPADDHITIMSQANGLLP